MSKERPILFSAPMVRALLAGTKTQTRRIVKSKHLDALTRLEKQLGPPIESNEYGVSFDADGLRGVVSVPLDCPYGVVGDRLWVREGFTHITGNGIRVHYRADGEPTDREGGVLPTEPGLRRWMSPLFMPRKLSRITLEVTEIRVQRLQDIDELDALAEGVEGREVDGVLDGKPGKYIVGQARDAYAELWDAINGAGSWEANPWVWVVEFERVEASVSRKAVANAR